VRHLRFEDVAYRVIGATLLEQSQHCGSRCMRVLVAGSNML